MNVCSICNNPRRRAINTALVAGTPLREVASEFNVSRSALDRHRREHLPSSLVDAKKADDADEASSLVKQLRELHRETLSVLEDAKKTQDSATVLSAIRRLEHQLVIEAKLLGELSDGGAPGTTVLISPEWALIRKAIVAVLEPWPEAMEAVAAALAALTSPELA